ncbi:hypothetical protein C8J57DRAFT_1214104 [Mycena rebaudengoi]|nr:hypothetical protein C8J57DRAFT_1214104 [Mycena rebaudengoi]
MSTIASQCKTQLLSDAPSKTYAATLPSNGATLQEAIEFLKTRRYGPSVESVLHCLSAHQLVLAAVSGSSIFAHISRFVRARGEAAGTVPEPRDGDSHFGRLPIEIATLILREYLDHIAQCIPFSRTSIRNRAIVALVLQQEVSNRLAGYNLDFYNARLLFCGTGTILSSSVIPLLVTPLSFDINDIDFFAPYGQGNLTMRFLRIAASLAATKLPDTYDDLSAITDIWELTGPSTTGQRCKINVIESASQNARDCVLLFHSTLVFGCLGADGLWHGEPALTLAGKALATPMQMPLSENLLGLQRTWAVLRKYTDRGFTFIAELDIPHDCGSHWNCPCTFRTTNDAGCLEMAFPLFPFPCPPAAHTGSWLLGLSSCSTHNTLGGLPVHSPSSLKSTNSFAVQTNDLIYHDRNSVDKPIQWTLSDGQSTPACP